MASEREAALTAALAELVALKYGPRDERYREAKEASWARAAQLLGPNAYEAELDRRSAGPRPCYGMCSSLGAIGLICTELRFHKGDHSAYKGDPPAMVTWPQVDQA